MSSGRLLLIGTPIGNLQDLSPRALEALRRCDLLLCEDTRHSGRLLQHFGVSVPLESFHDHNEDARTASVLSRLENGQTIGLISDAGMPLLSDPGFALVRAARTAGVTIEPVPGPFPRPSRWWPAAFRRSLSLSSDSRRTARENAAASTPTLPPEG